MTENPEHLELISHLRSNTISVVYGVDVFFHRSVLHIHTSGIESAVWADNHFRLDNTLRSICPQVSSCGLVLVNGQVELHPDLIGANPTDRWTEEDQHALDEFLGDGAND